MTRGTAEHRKGWPGLLVLIALAMLSVPAGADRPHPTTEASREEPPPAAPALQALYDRWRAHHERHGGDRALRLALRRAQLRSEAPAGAHGVVELNLHEGRWTLTARGLAPRAPRCLWWIESRGRGPLLPDAGDTRTRLGCATTDATGRLEAGGRFPVERLRRQRLDLLALGPAGIQPHVASSILARTSLFQRIYTAGRLAPHAAPATTTADLPALKQEGARLFHHETFGGNGRTCNTCHRSEQGHAFVADKHYARAPDHPLFRDVEDPRLAALDPGLLRAGLFRAHLGHLDALPVLRQVRSVGRRTLELLRSLQQETAPATEPSGWPAASTPHTRALLDYTASAVAEHFSRTAARTPGVDFRIPSHDEIDALAAYQLWVGTQQDTREHIHGPATDTAAAVALGARRAFGRR